MSGTMGGGGRLVRRLLLLALIGAAAAWVARRLSDDGPALAPPTGSGPAPFAAHSAPAVAPGPHPGSALPLDGGASPGPTWVVKGNANSMLYHELGGQWYEATVAEVWFETADAARAAGFAQAGHRTPHE